MKLSMVTMASLIGDGVLSLVASAGVITAANGGSYYFVAKIESESNIWVKLVKFGKEQWS